MGLQIGITYLKVVTYNFTGRTENRRAGVSIKNTIPLYDIDALYVYVPVEGSSVVSPQNAIKKEFRSSRRST